MWFTLYLHIQVKWVGTSTPSGDMHPARHMERFDETFETVEEFRCHSQRDADEIMRQTYVVYGGNTHTLQVQSVNEGKYRQIEARLCKACEELDRLEALFV
jgi:hypothetical protein